MQLLRKMQWLEKLLWLGKIGSRLRMRSMTVGEEVARMRRMCGLLAVAVLVLAMASPAAAQYVSPPGNGPQVGASDRGTSSVEHARASRSSGGVEVLGVKFVRGANGEAIALTGVDVVQLIGLGFGLVAIGVVIRRRSRHVGGATTA
jgi:hypothetical protein